MGPKAKIKKNSSHCPRLKLNPGRPVRSLVSILTELAGLPHYALISCNLCKEREGNPVFNHCAFKPLRGLRSNAL